jgi:hypothetical protein
MPIKHPRDETEIRQLAKDLAARWRRGDGVEPWLRVLEPELSAKVRRQRWSWESIARALNVAGITYETNRPWTGRSLFRKIATIRFEGRLVRQDSASMPEPQGQQVQTVMVPALSPAILPPTGTQSVSKDDEPALKPATLIRHSAGNPPKTPLASAPVAVPSIEAPARAVAASARTEPPVDASDESGASAPEEPTFRLVTLKGGLQPPRPQPSSNLPRREVSTPTEVSDDEIMRRVFGKT